MAPATQASTRAAFRATARARHGCAWFIWPADAPDRDPHNAGGWMAIEGKPATWFHAPSDLPSDVIWWTNLEPAAAWSLGRMSHIKPDGFLGLDWFALLSRWGRPQGPDATRQAVSLWSELFARLSFYLDHWCSREAVPENPLTDPKTLPSPHWSWGEGDFMEALARRLGAPMAAGPTAVSSSSPPGMEEAWSVQTHCDVMPHLIEGKRRLSLLLHPTNHAAQIRSTRVPRGVWREVPPSQWPVQDDRRWAWMDNHQSQPLIVRFDRAPVAHPGHEDDLRLTWGKRGRRFPGAPFEPVWMTGEEAMALRSCLAVAPSAVWVAEAWQSGPEQPWDPSDPSDALDGCSLLRFLLEGAFWRSWATPLRNDRRLRPAPTPLAVWWRAADRLLCLQAARACQDNGLTVLSYGNGQVIVAFDPELPLVDWERAVSAAGLMVPRDLGQIARVPEPPQFNAATIESWLLTSNQPLEAWFALDRMISPWIGDDRKQLKGLMSGTLNALSSIPPPPGAEPDWQANWRSILLERSRSALSALLPPSK